MAAAVGAIGLGVSLAGGILSAKGAKESSAAQQQMYNYQAQVAKINAQIDRQNADYARNYGEQQAVQYGMKAAQQAGAIKATQAASGIEVGTGSAAEVQRSQKAVTAMDLTQIRSNAAKVAYDYEIKAVMDVNQAGLYTMAGESAKKEGDIKAIGSILGTVSSVSSKWMQGKQMGLWGGGGND